jgi:hypothetical protein
MLFIIKTLDLRAKRYLNAHDKASNFTPKLWDLEGNLIGTAFVNVTPLDLLTATTCHSRSTGGKPRLTSHYDLVFAEFVTHCVSRLKISREHRLSLSSTSIFCALRPSSFV